MQAGVTSSSGMQMNRHVTSESRIKVMLVSGNYIMRVGLRKILESYEKVAIVGELCEKVDALEVIGREKPDVILVDLDMPDAVDLILTLRGAVQDSRIIALSSLDDNGTTRRALGAGASGVVLDVQPQQVLVATIESFYAESRSAKTQLSASESHHEDNHQSEKETQEPTKIGTLTAREREIISLLATGLANKGIADKLGITDTTVRHHLTNIFNKLDVSSRQKLLVLAHRHRLVKLTRGSVA